MNPRRIPTIAVLLVALATIACFDLSIANVNDNANGTGSTSSPAGPSAATGVDAVGITVFDTCPGGSASSMPRPCVQQYTANPTLAGQPVPPAVHGPDCRWYVNGVPVPTDTGTITVATARVTVQGNPFNVTVEALSPGTVSLAAEVKGVKTNPAFAVTVR
jgi:hypothetical protein